ncbi:MAG TPA: ATP phosphoribosyltransferase regulatory subunit [Alphaproteobacteria bacterium]|nr:ATP phosphoribosyltransferase regulatory subunit [Alphaproteobacteria bacterium]
MNDRVADQPTQLHRALLPQGFHDVLSPDAAHEAAVVERLVALMAGQGYDRVKPPLVEFEETLLGGVGAAMARETFRLMDPISQRMMGVRADMTLQIARIAGSRLRNAPRPLRLGYAGQVLQVKGTQLRPGRQFTQVGAELIGSAEPSADAEVTVMAAQALEEIGVGRLSLDLNVPTLVPAFLRASGIEGEAAASLRRALDRKDASTIAGSGATAAALGRLMAASGPAGPALAAVADVDLPDEAAAELARLVEVVRLVGAAAPDLRVTVDFVEHRGFEYHTGVSFTLFARGVRGELGRGGRYDTADGEPATGVTLFMDSVLRALPAAEPLPRLYVPYGTPPTDARALREAGWVAVPGLTPVPDDRAEARRLGCNHVLHGGTPVPLTEDR